MISEEVNPVENAGEMILSQIHDSNYLEFFGQKLSLPKFEPISIFGLNIDLSITRYVVVMWIASFLIFLIFRLSFRRSGNTPKGFANLLEMVIIFVRDEIAYANMGRKLGNKFLPYLLTIFTFILFCNLLGLVPFAGTPTSNLSVTGGLALMSFVAVHIAGVNQYGLLGYLQRMIPPGIPKFLIVIMWPMELLGLLTRSIALAVRLFANMFAGHLGITTLLFMIILFKTVTIAPVSVGLALFISILEILVAFIQAYIFTTLSSLFISMGTHSH